MLPVSHPCKISQNGILRVNDYAILLINGLMFLPNAKEKFLSFIFQPECFICGSRFRSSAESTSGNAKICHSCSDSVTDQLAIRCTFCSAVLNNPSPFGDRCALCREWKSKLTQCFSIGSYSGLLRSTIVEIKRDFHDTKAYQLGMLLGEHFELRNSVPIDAVVPVPSHWRRKWSRRGFQPSSVIADGFCKVIGLKKLSNALRCVKFVKKQSKMGTNQRIINVKKTFAVGRFARLQDLRILLIDDVMTSGATANECARVLCSAGVSQVILAVAARASGK